MVPERITTASRLPLVVMEGLLFDRCKCADGSAGLPAEGPRATREPNQSQGGACCHADLHSTPCRARRVYRQQSLTRQSPAQANFLRSAYSRELSALYTLPSTR